MPGVWPAVTFLVSLDCCDLFILLTFLCISDFYTIDLFFDIRFV